MKRTSLPALSAALALLLAAGLSTPAGAQTKLKFVLNWKYQGPQGIFFLPEDRGYYKAEGLELTIDQGNGSGAAVPLVANGTYDVGFGATSTRSSSSRAESPRMLPLRFTS